MSAITGLGPPPGNHFPNNLVDKDGLSVRPGEDPTDIVNGGYTSDQLDAWNRKYTPPPTKRRNGDGSHWQL